MDGGRDLNRENVIFLIFMKNGTGGRFDRGGGSFRRSIVRAGSAGVRGVRWPRVHG